MSFLKFFCVCGLFFFGVQVHAQFLPDNTSLNVQSVQRWMSSNRDFASVMQKLDTMHKSEEELKKFEALPAPQQDAKITEFLQRNNLLQSVTAIAGRHGWKSPGEYMRLSTRLGNAIAAYFFAQEVAGLTEAQKKAVRAKADPAVLNTPNEDIAFVKSHETLLKAYIQAYASGRR